MRSRTWPRVMFVGLVGLIFGRAPRVEASPSARLVFVRGPDVGACSDEAGFRDAVKNRVGYDPFFPASPRSVVLRFDRKRSVAAVGQRYVARMEILGSEGLLLGEKTFDSNGDDCQELVRTVALAVSLAIDFDDPPPAVVALVKEEEADAAPPAPVLPPEPPAPASSPSVADLPAAPEPSMTPPRWKFEGSIAVRGSLGIAREGSMGAAIGAGARRGPWSLTLEGRYDAPSSAGLEPRGDLSIGLLAGALVPCAIYRFLFGCTPLIVGHLNATSANVEHPASDSALHWSIGARAGIELPILSALAFRASAELLFVPQRHSVLLGTSEVWRTNVVAGSLSLGVLTSF